MVKTMLLPLILVGGGVILVGYLLVYVFRALIEGMHYRAEMREAKPAPERSSIEAIDAVIEKHSRIASTEQIEPKLIYDQTGWHKPETETEEYQIKKQLDQTRTKLQG